MTIVLTTSFSALALLATVGQAQPSPSCDDFENGVIDSSLWVWGGNKAGYGGIGVGSWQWSHTEADGNLQLRVWGPASGITYGAEAWVRTANNFNNGHNHMINFTWGASVNAYHGDAYAIEICNAEVDVGLAESSAWFAQDSSGNKNLYLMLSDFGLPPDVSQTNLPPTRWSILIDAGSQSATLYAGPDLTGAIIGQKALDPGQPWHVRFIQMDVTSGGFPEGDNSLFLYDFCSTVIPPSPSCDDFEDGGIDTNLWVWGGNKAGYGGIGVGDWQWSHTEAGGNLQLRVWGPASGITYGAEAWVRTANNFNDGLNHTINFTWGASVNAYHGDAFAIEICNTEVDVGLAESSAWFAQDSPGNKNLYLAVSGFGLPINVSQTNLPPTRWSILIDAGSRSATLYAGPDLTGAIIGQKALDPGQPWHLRFIQMDVTSAGYPAGDNSLFLYDFCSAASPTPPIIVTEPQSQTASLGKSVTLSIVASGYPPPTYQWLLNGTPIAGATEPSYLIPNAQPSDAGLYSVVVSNYLGSVTSVVASLTFAHVEIIGSVVINGTVGVNYRVECTCNLGGTPGWTTVTNLTLPSSPYRIVDWDSAGLPRRFYRVIQVP